MPSLAPSICIRMTILASLLLAGSHNGAAQNASDPVTQPWRLTDALDLPEWLRISGTHRSRYETLDGQFRTRLDGDDQMLAFRTTLRGDLKLDSLSAVAEVMDARQALADRGTPLDTGMVNTVELLQAFAAFHFDVPHAGTLEFRAGRQTLDLGSRVLVARNQFRNAINAFTGLYSRWDLQDRFLLQSFYFLPVTRQPTDVSSLLDNEIEFDDESFDLQLWGIQLGLRDLLLRGSGEIYLLGLHEDDSRERPTRNRQLYTPGFRFFRSPSILAWDFEVESALQFGTTKGTTASTDTHDLDHLAHFYHAEIGYTFNTFWFPRWALLYDYASGDKSPSDDESNRFDTLFGARRFDYGPTGIYGPFARANINSPGYTLLIQPADRVTVDAVHRFFWLASETDAWTTSGSRDADGQSGSFVGHQIEARIRWDLLPGNLRLEAGGALIFAGRFIERVPNATYRGDTTYGYLSFDLQF